MAKRPEAIPKAQRDEAGEADSEAVWPRLWQLVTRANVALQLLAGAFLLLLVDVVFMLRIRLGWTLRWPSGQSWPHWLMLALPAIVTLLWLTLAVAASLATYRAWRRSAQRHRDQAPPQPG